MNTRWDILGVGTATVDDFVYLESFPLPDSKIQTRGTDRQGGGLTATALVTAARLGMKCAFAGVLGYDEISEWILHDLAAEGIDTSIVPRREDVTAIHAIIIVEPATSTRTILFTMDGLQGADPESPDAAIIQQSKVVLIDDRGTGDINRVARIAHETGIPLIADFEITRDAESLALPDHLIIPIRYAYGLTNCDTPHEAAKHLWNDQREVVVLTAGADGCWYMGADQQVIHHPAFEVHVVDTTGCGDVFHGAYAAALVDGVSIPERIRFATAAAALKATQSGGRRGIPNRQQVEAFLREKS